MIDSDKNRLVKDYLLGDKDALEELIRDALPHVYRYLFRFVYNDDNAQELTQETFIKVWRKIKRFDTRKNFNTWVLSIARNTAIDFLRKQKRKEVESINTQECEGDFLEETVADELPAIEVVLDNNILATQLEDAIKALPLKYRETLMLCFYEDLSLEEISVIQNTPLNTVKTRKLRGIKLLKSELERMNLNDEK
jgi:RNA polymerase sigma-70 factor, ECF subfamily